ncbi:MFS transporter [Sanguibacter sp. Z1732]|uniref:MFS transporter n=1 Tax=Sanguibacter sp. Z1732 TaxID=3435412 RepID=UPI003D9CAD2A
MSMDISILFVASPAVTAHLEPTAGQWLWMMDIYSFVLAGLLVTMGGLADRIGRRRLLLIGAAAFGLASLGLAYAPTPETFITARALLGVGAATLAPSTLALVRAMFTDPTQRSTAVAVWTVAFTGGAVAGPVLGGFLLEHFWWGSVFLVNLPVMALLLVLAPLLVPESRNPEAAGFDLPGAGLSLVGIVAVVLAAKRFADERPDVTTGVTLVLGFVLLTLFVRRQRRSEDPLLDVTLFRNAAFTSSVLANALAALVMVGLGLLAFTYLQTVLGLSPFRAALAVLPTLAGSFAGAAFANGMARHLRPCPGSSRVACRSPPPG